MSTNIAPAPPVDAAPEALHPLTNVYRGYAMGLLLAISILNYIDRQVINIVAEPIKRELHLRDWQLGMMTGLAFGVLYTLLGLPIARLAERGNRPLIIATAAGVWSGFTALSGMAHNFWQLVLARIGVGIGEAGCTPPAHSLIMDYAAPEKRGSALALYGMGAPIGVLFGLAFGGIVADAFGWRASFLLAGAPGVLFAMLTALTLKEPRRALTRHAAQVSAASASLGEMFRMLGSKRSYWLIAAAITLDVFISYGYGPFIASFYLRNHPAQVDQAAQAVGATFGFHLRSTGFLGLALGGLAGVGGALGTWLGGQLADRFGPADSRRYVIIPAISTLLCMPIFIGVLTAPTLGLSLALLGLHGFVGAIWYGPAFTAVFSMTPSHMRATNSALILFLSNLLGLGLGPLAVGLASDAYGAALGAAEGVRWALVSLSGVGALAALLFWFGARNVREDLLA